MKYARESVIVGKGKGSDTMRHAVRIATPFPSVDDVAAEMGLSKKRTLFLDALMDEIQGKNGGPLKKARPKKSARRKRGPAQASRKR